MWVTCKSAWRVELELPSRWDPPAEHHLSLLIVRHTTHTVGLWITYVRGTLMLSCGWCSPSDPQMAVWYKHVRAESGGHHCPVCCFRQKKKQVQVNIRTVNPTPPTPLLSPQPIMNDESNNTWRNNTTDMKGLWVLKSILKSWWSKTQLQHIYL